MRNGWIKWFNQVAELGRKQEKLSLDSSKTCSTRKHETEASQLHKKKLYLTHISKPSTNTAIYTISPCIVLINLKISTQDPAAHPLASADITSLYGQRCKPPQIRNWIWNSAVITPWALHCRVGAAIPLLAISLSRRPDTPPPWSLLLVSSPSSLPHYKTHII